MKNTDGMAVIKIPNPEMTEVNTSEKVSAPRRILLGRTLHPYGQAPDGKQGRFAQVDEMQYMIVLVTSKE